MNNKIPNNKMNQETTFADRAIDFFLNLSAPENIPGNIKILNPYKNEPVRNIVYEFYKKFFNDCNQRIMLIGINPGRFGGGITGISFTDPVSLEKHCGIQNEFDKKTELSSTFIYSFIKSYVKVEEFYSKFFISALYPLALTKDGKNYNYYDDKITYKYLKTSIAGCLQKQVELGISRKFAVSLGKKNYKFLNEINRELNLFERILVLDHPRFIMQYRRKKLTEYIGEYAKVCAGRP